MKTKEIEFMVKKSKRVDIYKVLGDGLDEDSTEKELRSAYKKKALKWHPDRFSNKPKAEQDEAEVKFKEMSDAMDFLADAEKKALWDKGYDREEVEQRAEMSKQQGGGGGHSHSHGHGGFPGGFGGFGF